jgi:hypothetical protein
MPPEEPPEGREGAGTMAGAGVGVTGGAGVVGGVGALGDADGVDPDPEPPDPPAGGTVTGVGGAGVGTGMGAGIAPNGPRDGMVTGDDRMGMVREPGRDSDPPLGSETRSAVAPVDAGLALAVTTAGWATAGEAPVE